MKKISLLIVAILGLLGELHAQTVVKMPFTQNPKLTLSAEIVYIDFVSPGMTLGADIVINGGSGNYHYQWFNNETPMGTDATQYITSGGEYKLEVLDECDCKKYVTFSVASSVGDNVMTVFTVYPIPAKNIVKVKVPGNHALKQVTVVSTEGRIVRLFTQFDGNNEEVALDLSSLLPGEYIMSCVLDDNTKESTHIILQ